MMKTVSITDLKQKTADIIKKVKTEGRPVVVLQRSEPAAVLIDPDYYETLEEALEEIADLKALEERKNESTIPLNKYFERKFKRNAK